jgi:hypothetical protein
MREDPDLKKRGMLKTLLPVFAFAVLIWISACRPKPASVERRVENGVEVVINHVTRETMRNVQPPLRLDELFVIDSENDDIARLGISDIWGFDVDSAGQIFVFKSPLGQGDLVFKFDSSGRFLSSFCQKGEGPGELRTPIFQKLLPHGELCILDASKREMLVFDGEGKLLRESPIKPRLRSSTDLVVPLDGACYLYRRVEFDSTHPVAKIICAFSIVDSTFSEIKELDRIELEDANTMAKVHYPFSFIRWALSGDRVFLLNDERGYEIRSYDFSGDLVRRMKKEGPPVKYPEAMKQDVLNKIETPTSASLMSKIQFADPAPPCQHFWVDDEGRLYVVTYEPGAKTGEFIIDIFGGNGAYLGSLSLNLRVGMQLFEQAPRLDSWTAMKNDRFYCLREKDSGYLQLVVYRVHWLT